MQTGIFDKTRIVANLLMLVLVALNIFFSIQYTQNSRMQTEREFQEAQKIEDRLETARFMKFFVDKVLGSNGEISFEDRVKLENDIRTLGDEGLTKLWEKFVSSENGEDAQKNAVELMSAIANRMI